MAEAFLYFLVKSTSMKNSTLHQFWRTARYMLFLGLLAPGFVLGQYQFEASADYPYGRPNPDAPKEIKDWAPLIGTCQCTSVSRNPDQSWADPIEMTWTFKYIMNGWGVQDYSLKADGGHSGSIRQFIADSSQWYVHYYSNKGPTTELPVWKGGKQADSIVLYRAQKAPNGMDGFFRITFSDMTEDGFNWLGEWVDTAEQIQFPTWKIKCRRKK